MRAAAALALLLAGCAPKPLPAHPALWEIAGPHGAHGWLFGTVHALPRPVDWRTPAVADALSHADVLVVEVAGLRDDGATARAFAAQSSAPGLPALADRLPASLRPALTALLARGHGDPARLSGLKTWAAAIRLAQISEAGEDSGNGIDRALLTQNTGKPVAELEGAAAQFALFAALPEASQRALLAQVVRGAATADADAQVLAEAWRNGDMAAITAQTDAHNGTGLLADPALRAALYTGRNQRWATTITRDLTAGQRPFVAVGAAHMAGPEGLPALLAARGFTVRRTE